MSPSNGLQLAADLDDPVPSIEGNEAHADSKGVESNAVERAARSVHLIRSLDDILLWLINAFAPADQDQCPNGTLDDATFIATGGSTAVDSTAIDGDERDAIERSKCSDGKIRHSLQRLPLGIFELVDFQLASSAVVPEAFPAIFAWLLELLRLVLTPCTSQSEIVDPSELKEWENFFARIKPQKHSMEIATFLGIPLTGGKRKRRLKPAERLKILVETSDALTVYLRNQFTTIANPGSLSAENWVANALLVPQGSLGRSSRFNPLRGPDAPKLAKALHRPCRFCGRVINQLHRRAAKISNSSKPSTATVDETAVDQGGPGAAETTIFGSEANSGGEMDGPTDGESDTELSHTSLTHTSPTHMSPTHMSPTHTCQGATAEAEACASPEYDKKVYFHRSRQFCHSGCVFLYLLGSDSSLVREAVEARDAGRCSSCGFRSAAFSEVFRQQMRVAFGPKRDSNKLFNSLVSKSKSKSKSSSLSSKETDGDEVSLENIIVSVVTNAMETLREETAPLHMMGDKTEALCAAIRRRIVARPKREITKTLSGRFGLRDGDLWQADHTCPVLLGGGGAFSVFSFRTLCGSCHRGASALLKKVDPKVIDLRKGRENELCESPNEVTSRVDPSVSSTSLPSYGSRSPVSGDTKSGRKSATKGSASAKKRKRLPFIR